MTSKHLTLAEIGAERRLDRRFGPASVEAA
jgi:hypothetical protein